MLPMIRFRVRPICSFFWCLCLFTSVASAQSTRVESVPQYTELLAKSAGLSVEQRTRAQTLFNSGFTLWQSGDFAAAAMALRQGLEIDPANPQANFYYGDSLLQTRDRKNALEYLTRAAKLGPDTPESFKALVAIEALSKPVPFAELSDEEIRGFLPAKWEMTHRCPWGAATDTFTISGVTAEGQIRASDWSGRGDIASARISGKEISLIVEYGGLLIGNQKVNFRGHLTDAQHLEGTSTQTARPETCRWDAKKM